MRISRKDDWKIGWGCIEEVFGWQDGGFVVDQIDNGLLSIVLSGSSGIVRVLF